MLCRFGGSMEEEKSIVPVQEEVKDFQIKEIADVFNKAPSGTTVELNALTTGSYRYHTKPFARGHVGARPPLRPRRPQSRPSEALSGCRSPCLELLGNQSQNMFGASQSAA